MGHYTNEEIRCQSKTALSPFIYWLKQGRIFSLPKAVLLLASYNIVLEG